MKRLLATFGGAVAANIAAVSGVLAQGAENHARNGEMGMLPAANALAEQVHWFHNALLMPIITVISLFVLALLIIVIVRHNSKANPVAKKFSHNTLVEVLWTGIPILILVVIALFSFDLLFDEGKTPDGKRVVYAADGSTTEFAFANNFAADSRRVTRGEHVHVHLNAGGETVRVANRDYTLAGLGDDEVMVKFKEAPPAGASVIIDGGRSVVGPCGFFCLDTSKQEIALAPTMTLKVIGYQWGWSYAYPDYGDFEFASNMLPEDQTTKDLYLLAVDNPVYIPVGETIRITTTARDVIHSFALPNFAVKIDAIPGRFNETWIKADKPGTYYGQCSEICGIRHAYMPIEVRAVSRPEFDAWVNEQREMNGMEPMLSAEAATSDAAATLTLTQNTAADAADTE